MTNPSSAPQPTPKLADCLARWPYDRLRRMGRFLQIGLKAEQRNRKQNWIDAILACWTDPAQQSATWQRLCPQARRSCLRLAHTGSLPATLLLDHLGGLRPPDTLQRPWSPAEELYLAGLLWGSDGDDPCTARRLSIPADLVDTVQALSRTDTPIQNELPQPDVCAAVEAAASSLQPLPALVHDLGQLLIFFCLNRDLALRNGRRLPPHMLGPLARRLNRPIAPAEDDTHRQILYLRDLLYWARAGGLIDGSRLTPYAWVWLAQGPGVSLSALWNNWLNRDRDSDRHSDSDRDPEDLGVVYQQPDAFWNKMLRSRCAHHLARFHHPFHAVELADKLLGDEQISVTYFAAYPGSLAGFDADLRASLAGALSDLGIVQALADDRYVVTAAGRRLLEAGATPARAWRWTRSAARLVDEPAGAGRRLRVDVPRLAKPHEQAALALFARDADLETNQDADLDTVLNTVLNDDRADAERHRYQVDEATVAAASARGHGLPLLLDALHGLKIEPTDAQIAMLWRWWQRGRDLVVEVAPVVRTRDAAQLATLYRTPALRSLLGDVLAPTVALLRDHPADAVQALAAAGHYPTAQHRDHQPQNQSADESGALWLAGQAYLLLGDYLPLPLPLDETDLATRYATLDPAQQAALAQQATQMRRRLQAILDNLPYLPPPDPTDPGRWVDPIDQAIEDEAVLGMTYHSAGRNLLTRRRIHPLWRETHRGVTYVRARCIDTGSVLTFRLDRIFELESQ